MVCVVSVLLVCLGFPVLAEAGKVSGRVSLNNKPLQNGEFKLEKGGVHVTVKTDQDGRYEIFLAEGTYTVIYPGYENETIQSYAGPLQQDISLKKR